jgi:hypothetical protein
LTDAPRSGADIAIGRDPPNLTRAVGKEKLSEVKRRQEILI